MGWIEETLVAQGKVSAHDLQLFHLTDDVEEAIGLVTKEAGADGRGPGGAGARPGPRACAVCWFRGSGQAPPGHRGRAVAGRWRPPCPGTCLVSATSCTR
ncbi:hypothetical protein GCM10020221_20840 [Streptomyces thioluteus]|uniref:Uncharacterized protein n=1 Tax=Streptomyces thioluteus TaxID=66431 RepID=A0ABN3WQV3_STRTU